MREAVEAIAREAGALALGHFGRLGIAVDAKGPLDLVTEADRAVEALVVQRLLQAFPDDGILGEEGAARETRSGRTWVVDPIDGTFNFLRGGGDWAVSIGLFEDRRPAFGVIFAPARDQLLVGGAGVGAFLNGRPLAPRSGLDRSRAVCSLGFHPAIPVDAQLAVLRFVIEGAGMAFRNTGSTTTALIEVASGIVDGYLGFGVSSWDLMAAVPILEQLGLGNTVDWGSADLGGKLDVACGTPEFLAVFAGLG